MNDELSRSVLAIDFGGTQIRAARVMRDGSILDENYGLTGDGELKHKSTSFLLSI